VIAHGNGQENRFIQQVPELKHLFQRLADQVPFAQTGAAQIEQFSRDAVTVVRGAFHDKPEFVHRGEDPPHAVLGNVQQARELGCQKSQGMSRQLFERFQPPNEIGNAAVCLCITFFRFHGRVPIN